MMPKTLHFILSRLELTPAALVIGLAAAGVLAAHSSDAPLSASLSSSGRGSIGRDATSSDSPALEGQWADSVIWPVVAVSAHVLPNGKVLAVGPRAGRYARAFLWDPEADTFTNVSYKSTNMFCSGHAFLPDGRLFVAGGHVSSKLGLDHASLFDPVAGTWSSTAPMNAGRWYPTVTTLPDGDVLVVSGAINDTMRNTLPQVWRPDGTWRDLVDANLKLPLYPWMHVAPDGRVFYSGPERRTKYLDTSGTGAWSDVGPRRVGARREGTSVVYDDGKVLVVGGGDPPTNTAEVIDLNAPAPAWRLTGAMAVPRRQHNLTLLPDGKVLATGGTSGPGFNDAGQAVFLAETWDPQTELWTPLASGAVRRLYHSTAALLPDGRVLVAGGGAPFGTGGSPPDANHPNAEIFSPPYLFGPDGGPAIRPMIASAPDSVTYGETFFVETPDGAAISKVTWIRLSSVTHRFNANQRINRLPFALSVSGLGLDVLAPADPNVSPPGHYMLFILDAAGVPSVAKIVRIG